MTNEEMQKKVTDKLLEAFSILREYDENCCELSMKIAKNSNTSYYVTINNDAYKRDVRPVLINRFYDESSLKFKSAELDPKDIFDREQALESYDRAAKEVMKAAHEAGKEDQVKFVNIVVNTMRAAFNCQLYLDGRAEE